MIKTYNTYTHPSTASECDDFWFRIRLEENRGNQTKALVDGDIDRVGKWRLPV